MPGFDTDGVVYGLNVDFTGTSLTSGTAQVTTNGQLLIGSTATPNIKVGNITSPDNSLTIGYSSPNITLTVAGGSTTGKTITGNSGGALSPTAGNWNILGSGSITTAGSGSTLTTQLTGLTNHNILVGAGTTTITKVAPSATSGVPLISQGASADPAFGTAVVAGGGTGAVTLTGLLTGSGTSAIVGTAITQFNVLTGGATNLPNSVAPGATSGVPLISQGSSSQPIFGTALVAGGGTGVTSFTAYTPICGGTTTTGALQSVASIGTTAQVLTSNGASALPTFQTLPAVPTSIFQPNATIMMFDDFIGGNTASGLLNSNLSWSITGAINTGILLVNNHPGVVENTSLGTGAFFGILSTTAPAAAAGYASFILGGGILTLNWVFNIRTLSTGTNRYILDVGLGDTSNNTDQANGCYFEYSDNINSAQWTYKTAAASSRTTANSSITVTTGWHNAQIVVNAAASSVAFSMDGVSLGTAATLTIPTLGVTPFFNMYRTAGTVPANSVSLDLMYMTQPLTTPR